MSTDNFDNDIQDAQAGANQDTQNQVETTTQTDQEAEPGTDWKEKFVNSQKGALELLEDKKRLERENAELLASKAVQEESQGQTMENLYPGFEQLDTDAQNNLIAYTESVTNRVKADILKDPAIAMVQKNYNENVWDTAFNTVLNKYPELKDSKEEFKSKYFNANNVPSNIEPILEDVAKIHLFDKAKELGAEDEKTRQSRVETERTTGGSRDVSPGRTVEDWARIAQNPAKFASMSKEYNADLAAGKLSS